MFSVGETSYYGSSCAGFIEICNTYSQDRAFTSPILAICIAVEVNLAFGLDPDATFVHQLNLFLNDLLPVLVVLHGFAVEVEIFRIDWLFVEHLVEFSA